MVLDARTAGEDGPNAFEELRKRADSLKMAAQELKTIVAERDLLQQRIKTKKDALIGELANALPRCHEP